MFFFSAQFKRLSRYVREWIPHIGPLTKVIPLKLFFDIVPSSSADITRVLRGCFHEGSVYMYVVSFRFKARENLQLLWYFDYKQGSFGSRYVLIHLNKRRMPCICTDKNNWMNGSEIFGQRTNKRPTQARQPNEQIVKSAGRRSLPNGSNVG